MYHTCSDEELIIRLRDGETQIIDFLIHKYKNLVRKKATSMYILGADHEDVIQEGMIGLFKAVRDYDAGKDASFKTFLELCVTRQMYTAIQAAGRKKHQPLNTYISLYQEDTDVGQKVGGEILFSDHKLNPEEMVIDKERYADLESVIKSELSKFELQVLDLFLTGMGYVEIAQVLNKDTKSTDNALQRIRIKIRKKVTT